MTALVLLDRQRNDLKFLHAQSHSILTDFCKLTSSFIHKGSNMKLINSASQMLQVDPKVIQTGVESLAYIFLEAEKNKLGREDFKATIVDLGFPENSSDLIYEEYVSQRGVVQSGLSELGFKHYQYRNLEWRFEAQVSSRAFPSQNLPQVLLKFELDKLGETKNVCLSSSLSNVIHMSQMLHNALQDSKTNHSKRILRAVT